MTTAIRFYLQGLKVVRRSASLPTCGIAGVLKFSRSRGCFSFSFSFPPRKGSPTEVIFGLMVVFHFSLSFAFP